jgi:hypothetical protein
MSLQGISSRLRAFAVIEIHLNHEGAKKSGALPRNRAFSERLEISG